MSTRDFINLLGLSLKKVPQTEWLKWEKFIFFYRFRDRKLKNEFVSFIVSFIDHRKNLLLKNHLP